MFHIMASDFDKQQWQAEQAAHDAAIEKQREKERRARERSARNAQRKLERLHRTLREREDLSEFEEEFAESVSERLDKFGSAFADLEKGRPGDALSFAQKRVVAQMNKKVKALKRRAAAADDDTETLKRPRYDRRPARSSFKSKSKSKWAPNVRQLDETFEDAPTEADTAEPDRPPVGRPALRIVK